MTLPLITPVSHKRVDVCARHPKPHDLTMSHDLTQVKDVADYLQQTPFVCKSVSPLSGGISNFVFRCELLTAFEGLQTVIFKHARSQTVLGFPFDVQRQVGLRPETPTYRLIVSA